MRSVFMARLIGETEKIVDAAQIPAAEFSSQVVVGFTVDETGNVTQWRFLDNTCEGKDSVGVEPATPPHARGDDRGAGAARKVDSGDEGREADDLQLAADDAPAL